MIITDKLSYNTYSFMKIGNFDILTDSPAEADAEFIPLMTKEDEIEFQSSPLPKNLPILPLRNTVLFPGVVIPITVGRNSSVQLVNDANLSDKIIGVVAQKQESIQNPKEEDIFHIGTVARILRVLKMPDGNITIIIQGQKRFKIDQIIADSPYIVASVSEVKEILPKDSDQEFTATLDNIRDVATRIIKENPNIPPESVFAIKNIDSDSLLIHFISSNLNLSVAEKQEILNTDSLKERAFTTLKYINTELQRLTLKNDIQSRTRIDLDKQQREYFLHQQMKLIQEELGGVSYEEEIEEMHKKSLTKKWNEKVKEHFDKELSKLRRIHHQAPEYSIQRNYLELFLDLPWNEFSQDNFDLKKAQAILNKDHYGLEEVKRRIIEYLAVLKLRNDMKSPILCLYGPPGVGKTSLGKSIAESLGREYVRMSLGGLRDEAEIRGHRKTYIGAMPGRIIQLLKKAKTSNPVFVLDEIDKLSVSHNGDPSSALLEVLDPEQNNDFYDYFLEIGFDLSKVMFIATANSLSTIQPALRDRLEIIEVSGYTLEEKVQIAKQHLVPKQLLEHGVNKDQIQLSKKILETIIEGYTRESGVRLLEKQIAKVIRYIAKSIAMEQEYNPKIGISDIKTILGPAHLNRDKYENNDVAGVVTGLAWTSVGGDILFIESVLSKGKGKLSITGNIGNVMKESATLALEYIKANAQLFNINEDIFPNYDIHIHIPEGATPKDGPSAGITLVCSLVSLLTQKKVKKNIAMTGEITLRGKVLPVGGIKEKILAAKRASIKEIILSKENEKDIQEINPKYIEGLTFHYVNDIAQVVSLAITDQNVKNAKQLTL